MTSAKLWKTTFRRTTFRQNQWPQFTKNINAQTMYLGGIRTHSHTSDHPKLHSIFSLTHPLTPLSYLKHSHLCTETRSWSFIINTAHFQGLIVRFLFSEKNVSYWRRPLYFLDAIKEHASIPSNIDEPSLASPHSTKYETSLALATRRAFLDPPLQRTTK